MTQQLKEFRARRRVIAAALTVLFLGGCEDRDGLPRSALTWPGDPPATGPARVGAYARARDNDREDRASGAGLEVGSRKVQPQYQWRASGQHSSAAATPPPPRNDVSPPAGPDTGQSAAASQPAQQPPVSSEKILQRGLQLWRDGDIVAARAFFDRAAEAGSAEGALHAGATYDVHELAKTGAIGPKGDRELARQWYQKALDLGSAEAGQRLSRLR